LVARELPSNDILNKIDLDRRPFRLGDPIGDWFFSRTPGDAHQVAGQEFDLQVAVGVPENRAALNWFYRLETPGGLRRSILHFKEAGLALQAIPLLCEADKTQRVDDPDPADCDAGFSDEIHIRD
jgi:hypothetical protein